MVLAVYACVVRGSGGVYSVRWAVFYGVRRAFSPCGYLGVRKSYFPVAGNATARPGRTECFYGGRVLPVPLPHELAVSPYSSCYRLSDGAHHTHTPHRCWVGHGRLYAVSAVITGATR